MSTKRVATIDMPGKGRHILLLQGPCSWFFSELSAALRRNGASVTRVLLCPGDRLFWRGSGAVWFKGHPGDWPDWIAALAETRGITDVVSLGDGRHWHRAAIDRLTPAGIHVWVVEQGYLRPGWLTIETGGTGGNSRFPTDADQIRRLASTCKPSEPRAFTQSFAAFSAMDVGFSLANLLAGWAVTPRYRSHYLDPPLKEWAGWIGKAVRWPWRWKKRDAALARIADHTGPLFLMPLQLETDFQIRLHGPDSSLMDTLDRVLEDFRTCAGRDALLVVKPHPLDNGWTAWHHVLARHADERIIWLDGGRIEDLHPRLSGVLTVNSTVGLTALQDGVPVKVLGKAIYSLDGLCHQGELCTFWHGASKPDRALCSALVKLLSATIQVPGAFDGSGTYPGAEAVANRILEPVQPWLETQDEHR